jgi:hypothetical protein
VRGELLHGISVPEPNIFLRICTHTQTITISIDLCPPIALHVPTHAHPHHDMCPPMSTHAHPCYSNCIHVFKNCVLCITPTPSLGWIRKIIGRSLSLALVRSASWLAYSLHPRSLTLIWSWMQGCTKLMPTHAHPKSMGIGGHGHGHPM